MNNFLAQWSGRFEGLLKWQDFDDFWQLLARQNLADWYIYAIGDTVPSDTSDPDTTLKFLNETADFLKKQHDENYCSVVYVDNKQNPTMIKIFDPNNLGVSCGCSENPPLPAWVMSKTPPSKLGENTVTTNKNRRWWQAIFK